MRQTAAARRRTSRSVEAAAVGFVLAGAIVGGLLSRLGSASTPSLLEPPRAGAPSAVAASASASPHGSDQPGRGGEADATTHPRAALTKADGVLPAGVTVFDDRYPGIARLDPDLLRALRRAASEAADDGIELHVTSGWRSAAYQDQLLRQAISTYESEEQAGRWVATAATSPHVAGEAVDIGPAGASAWLSHHGAGYGLCQIYGNEPWHYELRVQAIAHGCPAMYADPTHDPRMQP